MECISFKESRVGSQRCSVDTCLKTWVYFAFKKTRLRAHRGSVFQSLKHSLGKIKQTSWGFTEKKVYDGEFGSIHREASFAWPTEQAQELWVQIPDREPD